jgi:hypothetical protein
LPHCGCVHTLKLSEFEKRIIVEALRKRPILVAFGSASVVVLQALALVKQLCLIFDQSHYTCRLSDAHPSTGDPKRDFPACA